MSTLATVLPSCNLGYFVCLPGNRDLVPRREQWVLTFVLISYICHTHGVRNMLLMLCSWIDFFIGVEAYFRFMEIILHCVELKSMCRYSYPHTCLNTCTWRHVYVYKRMLWNWSCFESWSRHYLRWRKTSIFFLHLELKFLGFWGRVGLAGKGVFPSSLWSICCCWWWNNYYLAVISFFQFIYLNMCCVLCLPH